MTDILIIDDTVELASLLSDFLIQEGFTTITAHTGEAGLEHLNREDIRLVLLDIMLPGMDGFAVCEHIRKKYNVPLFIMSAKTDKDSQLNGLLLGADDYIEKPFDIDVLIAKIKAVYKRNYETSEVSEVMKYGDICFDASRHEVTREGNAVNLTVKEYELLKFLMENEGKALTKDAIFNKVWGVDSFSEPSTLTVHIKWLRQKLESDEKKPEHIQTVWGVGYRFSGDGMHS